MSCSRIFVRGLPPSLNADEFRTHFSTLFTVTDARLIPHRKIGYVGYKSSGDAAKAVKYYNKSFIRMSRIGVELARSVEEQHTLKPVDTFYNASKRKEEARETGCLHGSLGSSLPETQNRKKVKTARLNEEHPKLHEFLEVMQPPSKSRHWEDRATPEPQCPTNAGPDVVVKIAAGCDADADVTKYPVPVQEGHEVDHEETERPEQPNSTDQPGTNSRDDTEVLDDGKEQEFALTVSNMAPEQSDADWLRSRTSRVLGLVDDEDDQLPRDHSDDDQVQQGKADEQIAQTIQEQMFEDEFPMKDGNHKENVPEVAIPASEQQAEVTSNGRLFVRNIAYCTTEDDLRQLLENGNYSTIEEVHLPIDSRTGNNKGFAHIQFTKPEHAAQALSDLDKKPFQGRLLHVMPAEAKKDNNLDDFAISKLPLKKQQQIKRRAEAATSTFNWNAMYMNTDAIMSSISKRLGVAKSELLDPTSSDAAVKQAHAETHIIQETKAYFTANGVDLDSFKCKARGDTGILIKNFAYGTKLEELNDLFKLHGPISRLLLPPSGTIAIVEFSQPDHARSAFSSLAYRKFKDTVLFLEKAPKVLFKSATNDQVTQGSSDQYSKIQASDLSGKDELSGPIDTSTLFVRNLNFITTTERLREVFQPLDGFLSARVKTKADPKRPGQLLSMGFGFLEFRTKDNAQTALRAMNGYKLDGHDLLIRASHRSLDAAEERRKEDQAKKEAGRKTKIIIKNLPFQASKKDVRSLFGAYGQLRSVRVPKKFDSSTRGFAFAEFVTAREAESAMNALRDTHLLGRRLVLEFTAEDAIDPEQEIEKIQQKVGTQADKVALQRLTGSARKKFNVEGAEEVDQG